MLTASSLESPDVAEVCFFVASKTSGRHDDKIESIKKRVRTFVAETAPVVKVYVCMYVCICTCTSEDSRYEHVYLCVCVFCL
jgi:adenylate kinase family enzyme